MCVCLGWTLGKGSTLKIVQYLTISMSHSQGYTTIEEMRCDPMSQANVMKRVLCNPMYQATTKKRGLYMYVNEVRVEVDGLVLEDESMDEGTRVGCSD